MSVTVPGLRIACLATVFCAALLAACGGAGSSDMQTTPPSTGAYPVGDVVTRLTTSGGSFSGSRLDSSGKQNMLQVDYTAGVAGWFTRRETLLVNGVGGETRVKQFNFSSASTPFQVIGWKDDRGNTATQLQGRALPTTTSVGSGANLFSAHLLIENNGLNTSDVGLTHRLSYDWSLASVGAASTGSKATADLCLALTQAADFITETKVDCFQIDTAGSIAGFKSIVKVHAKSVDSEIIYQ